MPKLALAIAAALLSTAALGQEKPPQLPPEGKRWVERFVGTAKSRDVQLTMGGKRMTGRETVSCKRVAGGWAAECTRRTSFKGMPRQEAMHLVGWDVEAGEAHMFEVSSLGEAHDHVGKWTDDRTITVTRHGRNAAGEAEEESLTFRWMPPETLEVHGTGSVGGKPTWTLQASYVVSRMAK